MVVLVLAKESEEPNTHLLAKVVTAAMEVAVALAVVAGEVQTLVCPLVAVVVVATLAELAELLRQVAEQQVAVAVAVVQTTSTQTRGQV